MRCPSCGYESDEGANYCLCCGMALVPAVVPPKATPPAAPAAAPAMPKRRGPRMTGVKMALLTAADIALIALISLVPWLSMRMDATMAQYTLPRLSLKTLERIFALISEPIGRTDITSVTLGFVLSSLWLVSVVFLAWDAYHDISSHTHTHVGHISVLVLSGVSIAWLLASVAATGGTLAPEMLLAPPATWLFTLTLWPLAALGASSLALLLDALLS